MFRITFLPSVNTEEQLEDAKVAGEKFLSHYSTEYIGWHLPEGAFRKGPTWVLGDNDGMTAVGRIKENENNLFGPQGFEPKVRFESGFIIGELVLSI